MDKLTINLGTWFGVQVKLHWTITVFFAIILLFNQYLALFFFSVMILVLLHEFGHCFAAHYYKVEAKEIILNPLFGLAMIRPPQNALIEAVIALSGPMANLFLIPFLYFASCWIHSFFETILYGNLIIFGFNLLPLYPLDGGRVVRAILFHCLNNYNDATLYAARISQITSILLVFPATIFLGLIFGASLLAIALVATAEIHNLQASSSNY